jgi:heme exporter protein C
VNQSQRKPFVPLPEHLIAGWALVVVTLWFVGFWVPPSEEKIGESYLIFFFHFPSAVNGLNLFLLAGVLSLAYLVRRRPALDLWAASAVEVGLLATTVTLVTGSIWAKVAWGIWWSVSDPRLMSVAFMWLMYLGYVALRSTLEEAGKRAQFCAVFGALATLNVPVVLFSIRVLGAEHHPPMAVTMSETSMVVTRWFGVAAFFVLYTALWRLRHLVLEVAERKKKLEEGFARAGA